MTIKTASDWGRLMGTIMKHIIKAKEMMRIWEEFLTSHLMFNEQYILVCFNTKHVKITVTIFKIQKHSKSLSVS